MKQYYKHLLAASLALFIPMREAVYAQAPEIRSRFIAATLDVYEGSNFKPYSDSIRIHWHDTCGAGFDYYFFNEGSIPDYLESALVGYQKKSKREYNERRLQPFVSLDTYAPASTGGGYLSVPKTHTTQVITGNNVVDNYITVENGQTVDRQENFYDASGNLISSKRYMATTTGPVLAYIDSFRYDNNGNLLIEKSVNMLGTVPVIARIIENTYDSNNNLIKLDHTSNGSGSLSLINSTVFSYNTSGLRTGAMVAVADPATGVLSDYRWEGYTYNSSNQMDSRSQAQWSATGWDSLRVLYQYGAVADRPETAYRLHVGSQDTVGSMRWFINSNGLCDSLIQSLHTGPGQWLPYKKTTLRYNAFRQPTFMETQTGFNNASNSWSNLNGDARSRFYYETFNTGTGINDLRSSLAFSLYPNPVQHEIHIRAGSETIRLLTVYDLSGRVLIRQRTSGYQKDEVILQLGALPAGVYTLKADGERTSGSKKFIVY
jgi:hypothetical protein